MLRAACALRTSSSPLHWLGALRTYATAATIPATKYCKIELENDVAVINLDVPDSKVNTLSSKMMGEFEALMTELETSPTIKAAVLISAKKDNFIAGADIKELSACTSASQAAALSKGGQVLMDRLARCPKPIVAAINGQCLGGGLELALACHYRIVTANKKTQLGVPEVMLGLLPGAGGTQRLPKLVGLQMALDMCMTGKNIRPDKAVSTGLANKLVDDPEKLRAVAVQCARDLADNKLQKAKPYSAFPKSAKELLNPKTWMNLILETNPMGRNVVFTQANKMMMEKTFGNYPAPIAIIKCIQTGINSGHTLGSAEESRSFGELSQTPESAALIGLFNAITNCKKAAERFGEARDVNCIGVLGAGLMGAGIVEVSAPKYRKILLKDVNDAAVERGMKQITDNYNKLVKKKKFTPAEMARARGNIVTLTDSSDLSRLADADLVVEAVPESMAIKHRVIKDLEQYIKPSCIFATNTSALSVAEIASASKRPENVVGMHYFSPVDKMMLLEIITHPKTSKEVAATAVKVGLAQGKHVVVVRDVPGFYVNRSLGPYMAETFALLLQGVDGVRLDKVMTKFGWAVGPVTLVDEVGVDIAMHVQESLVKDLGVRMAGGDASLLHKMIEMKYLGKKSGKGFYVHEAKSKGPKPVNKDVQDVLNVVAKKSDKYATDQDVAYRCTMRFANEAFLCLQNDYINSPLDGDLAAVFGVGFPPFLGGPFRWADRLGAQAFVDQMRKYQEAFGEQFAPAQILIDNAKAGKKFHTKETN